MRVAYVNERHILEAEFQDLGHNPVNVSDGIVVYILTPNGATETGPFAATRTEKGIYRYDYYPSEPGKYYYRFQTPTGSIASEKSFNVKRSKFGILPPFPQVVGIASTPDYVYTAIDAGKAFGVLDVPSYSYIGVDGSSTVVEVGIPPSYVYTGVDGQLGFHPMTFMVTTSDEFYTMNGIFDTEEDTGLDLTGLDIISIDRNPIDGVVWGLGGDGTVHKWNEDGTGLVEDVIVTGFADLTDIMVDIKRQLVAVSAHTAAPFNDRTYFYSFAGVLQNSVQNRAGTNQLAKSIRADGDYCYLFEAFGGSTVAVFRLPVTEAAGEGELLQSITSIQSANGAFDVPNLRAWQFVGGQFVLWDLSTVAGGSGSFVSSTTVTSGEADECDYMEWDGDEYVVGAGGGKLWSWEVNDFTTVKERTAINIKALCTRRPYVV